MTKIEELKSILEEFGVYSLIQNLNLDYNIYVKTSDYRDKVTPEGLKLLNNNPEVKNHILPMVFALEANGLMQTNELFIANHIQAYDKLLVVLESEEYINQIFKISSALLSNKDENWEKYRNRFAKFLGVVIEKSKSLENIRTMLVDFTALKKSDKTDYFPVIKSFLDKGISADELFSSIQSLNNSYLETRMVEYLYSKDIPFSFKINALNMYESEEKTIIEKSLHFNTNYFMSLGITEDKVNKGLEKFADLICNEEEINYLIKRKEKKLSLITRSSNEEKINNLYKKIKDNSHLIQEFVQGFDGTLEYQKRFKTYWYLNQQFTQKESKSKIKI